MSGGNKAHSSDVIYGLMDLARKKEISWKEVEETILRVALRKMKVIPDKCKHDPQKGDIVARRDGSRPHCRKCWTFMKSIGGKPRGDYKGEYEPMKNAFEEELMKTLQFGIGEDHK